MVVNISMNLAYREGKSNYQLIDKYSSWCFCVWSSK